MAFSPNFHLAHFNQHRHLYDDEYCDHPDKDGRDDDVSDECQSVCEGIRVQYIPLTEIRFAIETVISKYSLFPYKYIGSQTPLFLWDFVTDNDEVGTNV